MHALLMLQTLLGTDAGSLGTVLVDILRTLGAVHQHHHVGRRHLGNAIAYQDVLAFTVHLKVQDTVRGFAAIVDGEADDLPEWAFFNVGTLEDARQKAAEKLAEEKGGAV